MGQDNFENNNKIEESLQQQPQAQPITEQPVSQPTVNSLQPVESEPQPATNEMQSAVNDAQPEKKKPKKIAMIIMSVVIVALMIAVVVLAILLIRSSGLDANSGDGSNLQSDGISNLEEVQKPQIDDEEDNEAVDDVEINDSYFVSDETKYVITIETDEEGLGEDEFQPIVTHMVYTYIGNEITGLKTYFKYKDAKTAQKVFQEYQRYGESSDITISGSYIIFTAGPEEYEGITVSDIKQQIEFLEQIKNMDEQEDYE